MAEEISRLEQLIENLIEQLGPAQRKMLLRRVATELRKRNVQRIRKQVDPDGNPFAPRKLRQGGRGVKRTAGRRKRMFLRAVATRHFKVRATPDEAEVGFLGNAGRIMAVHHYGLRDRVTRELGSPEVSYPERRLIGLPQDDIDAAMELLLSHLQEDT